MPLSEDNNRIGTNVHRLIFLVLIIGPQVIEIIEFLPLFRDIALKVQHTFSVNLIIEDSMAGGTLFHKLGEHPRVKRLMPFLLHRPEKFFPYGFASPERNNLLAVDFPNLFRNHKACFLSAVDYA